MATLNFKGKSAVWNHHLSVPYHTLEKNEKNSLKGQNDTENLIVQGDNLLALKALLPQYQGKVKCIYIDPPYNTGNEGWVYNDSVSSPTIKEWMGKAVGKEGEDLTRHDKWLCMMTPRLKLLRELLKEEGVIFISIDENEVHRLRVLLDDIFGGGNFISQLSWKGKAGAEDDKHFRTVHEYVLCFAKNKPLFHAGQREKVDEKFPKYDAEAKRWYKTQLARKWGTNSRREDRPNLYYAVTAPDGSEIYPKLPKGAGDGRWRWARKSMDKEISEGNVEFVKEGDGWIVYEKIWQPTEEEGFATKKFNTWLDDVGSTSNGTDEVNEIFGEAVFDHPKPTALIKRVLQMAHVVQGDIVLDSFAGSGTTAHGVLGLSAEDKKDRKFILVEMEDYANSVTAERIRRVIKQDGLAAGFTYYKLGQAIDAETLLAGDLPEYKEFAKYVYYLASGKNHSAEKSISEKTFFVGKAENETVYLLYKQDIEALKKLAITLDWARDTHEKDSGKKIVYAPACYLDDEALEQYNIKFVSIPYNLFERT